MSSLKSREPAIGRGFSFFCLAKLDNATTAAAIGVSTVQLPYLISGGIQLISLVLNRINLPIITHVTADDEATSEHHDSA